MSSRCGVPELNSMDRDPSRSLPKTFPTAQDLTQPSCERKATGPKTMLTLRREDPVAAEPEKKKLSKMEFESSRRIQRCVGIATVEFDRFGSLVGSSVSLQDIPHPAGARQGPSRSGQH